MKSTRVNKVDVEVVVNSTLPLLYNEMMSKTTSAVLFFLTCSKTDMKQGKEFNNKLFLPYGHFAMLISIFCLHTAIFCQLVGLSHYASPMKHDALL